MSSTVSVPTQACKPAVVSPTRPKPRLNPRRKLIDPTKADAPDRVIFRSVLMGSKLNARAVEIVEATNFLLELITDTRERAEGLLYAELVNAGFDPNCDIGTLAWIEDDCAGVEWVLNQFVQAMRGNVMPRSPGDLDRIYGEDPNVKYATSDELLAAAEHTTAAHSRRKSR